MTQEIDNLSDESIELISHLFASLNKPDFAGKLNQLIASLIPVDYSLILCFRENAVPILLFDQLAEEEKSSFYNVYMKGGYLLSPYYNMYMDHCESGCYTLKSIAPKGFYESNYYKRYYLKSFVGDELALLINLDNNTTIFIGLTSQSKRGDFLDTDFQILEKYLPLVNAAVKAHWENNDDESSADVQSMTLHDQFQLSLKNFGRAILTDREYDVIYLMLQGYSTKSAARKLQISPETERGYRKQIYTKLNISSCTEACSIFFTAISSDDMNLVLDPSNISPKPIV